MTTTTYIGSVWDWNVSRNALMAAAFESMHLVKAANWRNGTPPHLAPTDETFTLNSAAVAIDIAKPSPNDDRYGTRYSITLPRIDAIHNRILHYVTELPQEQQS